MLSTSALVPYPMLDDRKPYPLRLYYNLYESYERFIYKNEKPLTFEEWCMAKSKFKVGDVYQKSKHKVSIACIHMTECTEGVAFSYDVLLDDSEITKSFTEEALHKYISEKRLSKVLLPWFSDLKVGSVVCLWDNVIEGNNNKPANRWEVVEIRDNGIVAIDGARAWFFTEEMFANHTNDYNNKRIIL